MALSETCFKDSISEYNYEYGTILVLLAWKDQHPIQDALVPPGIGLSLTMAMHRIGEWLYYF